MSFGFFFASVTFIGKGKYLFICFIFDKKMCMPEATGNNKVC